MSVNPSPESVDKTNQPLLNVWNTPAPKSTKNQFPKKKAKWGLIEVVNSLVILFVTQLILGLVIVAKVTSEALAEAGSSDAVDQIAITEKTYDTILSPQILIISGALMYASWLFMMWYSTRFRGLKSFAKDFWLKIKWRDIPIGLGLAVVLLFFVQGLSWLIDSLGIDMAGSDNTLIFKGHGVVWEYILILGLVGLAGPIMEELFFRGFLLQGLIRHFRRGNVHEPRGAFGAALQLNNARLFNGYLSFRNFCYKHKYTLSIIISSISFGFMHFNPEVPLTGALITVFLTGTLGLVFAIITVRTRRLGIAIFGHIFYNTMVGIISVLLV